MPQPADPPMLSYAVKPRRRWRRYVLGFIVILLVGAGVHRRTVIAGRITHLYWQHRVETFEYPKGTVVLEVNYFNKEALPASWQTLGELEKSPNYKGLWAMYLGSTMQFDGDKGDGAGFSVPEVGRYNPILAGSGANSWPKDFDVGALFVGEMKSHAGTKRIVDVSYWLWLDQPIHLLYGSIVPATLFKDEVLPSSPVWVSEIKLAAKGGFRAFGGQRDPADSSRFTIDYETATEKGTIVGVLQDDGSVVFSIVKR